LVRGVDISELYADEIIEIQYDEDNKLEVISPETFIQCKYFYSSKLLEHQFM